MAFEEITQERFIHEFVEVSNLCLLGAELGYVMPTEEVF